MLASLRRLARSAITATARDLTASAVPGTALVLAPHPDDETLGCGALILRKRAAGTSVVVVLVTDGAHSHASATIGPEELVELRRVEMVEAAARLGLPQENLRWLGIEDGTVSAHEDALLAALQRLLAEFEPDEVYATGVDEPHPDHAAVGRAARRAVAGSGARLFEYPIWLWNGWPFAPGNRLGSGVAALTTTLRRGAVVVRTDGYSAAKLHALDAHHSQLRRPQRIPADEPWEVLPAGVLEAAAGPVELFLPIRTGPGRAGSVAPVEGGKEL